ncbi:MAG: rRNA maturation RNase YbeY [Methylococcales bacterium]|nr:rRNA maturation RNase YbeY [Methylococcales bacterium]
MNVIDVQIVSQSEEIPTQEQFQYWVDAILTNSSENSEIVIRIVDEPEMIQFNHKYRNKEEATNILSFPFEIPDGVKSNFLGDLLICTPIIEKEALLQNKELDHHWSHMIVHGVLHLLGYDHIDNHEAEEMEALEIKILKKINIENPYQETN